MAQVAVRKLKAESIKKLSKQDFEDFCWQLLTYEQDSRWTNPKEEVRLRPPSEEDWPDGGRDIQALVYGPPHTKSAATLLPDRPCEAWYSCKTHQDDGSRRKRSDGWKKQVRKNLDPTPRVVSGDTGELVDNAEQNAKDKKPPPPRLLRALADGGEFIVLVNVSPGAGPVEDFEHELHTLFRFWIERELGREAPTALAHHVRVFGAHEIANAYNKSDFSRDSEWQRLLGLEEPDFLRDWDRWSASFAHERRFMDFRPDHRRKEALAELGKFLTSATIDDPVIRLWGAPGVGKTRLVHYALDHPEFHARVRFTQDVKETPRWLNNARAEDLRNIILVIDEVPPLRAGVLADAFAVATERPARARLILIGPKREGVASKPTPIELYRLDDAEIREIIAHELRDTEAGPEVVDVIAQLSEGFPLHALWLSKALAVDTDLLREPRRLLTGGEDPWLATSRVLAGAPSADEDGWHKETLLRGKALLMATLTPDEDWDDFDDELEQSFARALRVDWNELRDAARACEQIGLLRRVGRGHRYVSPANLERLILNHFFGDGPSGPPLDPRRLRAHFTKRYARLLERSRIVGASDACVRTLTAPAIDDLRRALLPAKHLVCGLGEVAYLAPEPTAPALRSLVLALGPETIVREVGGSVRSALQHLSHRKLSAGAFGAVEDGLWMLAWSGYAKRSWAELFATANTTHAPFDLRLACLRRRLHDPLAQRRVLALLGLEAVLNRNFSGGYTPGWDDVDAVWARPKTRSEEHGQLSAAWRVLLHVARDQDPKVSHEASRLFRHMDWETGLGVEPGLVQDLAELAASWTSTQRNGLVESLWVAEEDIREEPPGLAPSSWLGEAFESLRQALIPRTLEDRLVTQVGSWVPALLSGEALAFEGSEEEGDRALAEELILQPEFVRSQLEWLGSERAVRTPMFGEVVGEVDTDQALLPVLLASGGITRAPSFVAAYLVGWGHGPESEGLDDWVARSLPRSELAEVLVRALIGSTGSDHRAQLLVELLDNEHVRDSALLRLGYSTWADDVSTTYIDRLIILLVARGHESNLQALGLAARRFERSLSDLDDTLREAVGQLVAATAHGRLPSIAEREWSKLVRLLSVVGDVAPLQHALQHAASPSFVGYPHHLVRALSQLLRTGQWETVWTVVRGALEARCRAEAMREVLVQAGVFKHIPTSTLTSWIGDDLDRGIEIAHFTQPLQQELDPLARALICRFGATGAVARIIERNASSPPDSSSKHVHFFSNQADKARAWQRDPEQVIVAWARSVETKLRALAERERLDNEYERRYYG